MTTSSPDGISDEAVLQNSAYIKINVEDVLYGIELFLYFKTIHILLMKGSRKKSHVFYMLFSSTMLFLITVWVATQAVFGEKVWIEESNYPGGPGAYWPKHASDWYLSWGRTAVLMLQFLTDGLMIYRCWIIWNSHRAIVIPIILWLVNSALGILFGWVTCAPEDKFLAGAAPKIGLAYYSVSIFLNTTLTGMICYHIIRHAREIREHLGPEHASLYFTAVTIIVESVLPYTVSGVASLVTLGIGSPTSVAFVSVYFLMMCISPQMLILRVIEGRALDEDTFKRSCSTLEFSFGGTTRSQQSDRNTVTVHPQTLPNVYLPEVHAKV